MKSKKSITPQARTTGVVVEQLADEVLVYDLDRDRAHCLNQAAARVWERCDGQHSVSEIGAEVGGEEAAWMAVEQLSRAGLLEEKIKRPAAVGVSRREVIKRIAAAAAVGVPVVTSIIAPTASHAANCIPTGGNCSTSASCCSGLCNAGRCA